MAITVTKRADGNADVRVSVPIAKTAEGDAGTLKVFGWASIATDAAGNAVVDHQDDVIPPAELEAAAYEFAKSAGPANVDHAGPDVGRLIESIVFTPDKREAMGLPAGSVGWWVGFELNDADAIAKVKSGELKEFSIEGEAVREPLQEAA